MLHIRAGVQLAALIGVELGAITALHRLGRVPWFQISWSQLWVPGTNIEDTLAGGLRYMALGFAYWLAVSTLLYLVVRSTRVPAAIQSIEWMTLPSIRRIVDRTIAISLAVGTTLTPAAAIAQTTPPQPVEQTVSYTPTPAGWTPPVMVVTESGAIVPPGQTEPATENPSETPFDDKAEREAFAGSGSGTEESIAVPEADDDLDGPILINLPVAAAQVGAGSGSSAYTVQQGDNLWAIATNRLKGAGLAGDDASIATYWVELIAANVHSLSSGDPDLIYPGEVITLPELP